MGRWLTALKKHETPTETNRQNRQKSSEANFVGFVGSGLGRNQKICEPTNGLLSVLSVPLSGEIEKSPPDPDAFKERAAKLEHDAGLSPAEAERHAIAEAGQAISPKTDAEAYADALREIGPCGYGPIAVYLGWGATKAGQVEVELRQAGRIIYDNTGRGRLVEDKRS